MKKLLLAYNPVSGDALFKYKLDDILALFQAQGCLIVPYRTLKDRVENERRFLACAAAGGVDGVLIAGGDGTLHEIVNILLRNGVDLPVGVLASGTSNDFASFLGIDGDLERYVRTVASGATTAVDVGKAGGQYFINVASAGALTSVAHKVDAGLKNAIGKMAYYLRGLGELPNFRALDLTIEADGALLREKAFLFVIVNSGTVGSLKNIAKKARVDDGKLDLIVVRQSGIPDLMALIVEIVTGGDYTHRKNVLYLQAAELRISCSEPLESDLDGELGPALPLAVATLPGRLRIFYEAKRG